MLNTIILSYVTFTYFTSFIFYLLLMVMGKELFGKIATYVTMVGIVGHSIAIILRWFESYRIGIGHAPLSNLFESLIFFSWTIIFLYLIIEWRTRNRSLGTFAAPLAFIAMAYASYSPNIKSSIQPLVPALQSNWLITHVITCFFGYAAFAIAFGLSIMYLIKRLDSPEVNILPLKMIPGIKVIDELTYQIIVIGFIMLSLGIITGSVWAHSAWGSYWSWDPKETWSLITWFIYAIFLHSRLLIGWKGKASAVISMIGFCCVLFTYFGVNFLAGLHSYAK